jgi:AcrR family transcriptional regulator
MEVSSREARRPGRPRSAAAEAAILDATLELLAERGLEGLSIEAVAARAGVGKATIYRRWPSRDAVIAAAFRSVDREVRFTEAGEVRQDMTALMSEFQRATLRSIPVSRMPRLLAAALTTPELRELFLVNVFEPRRAALLGVLERAQSRGEVRADMDLRLAFAMTVGPILLTGLLGSAEVLDDPDLPARLVDAVLLGLAPR